MSSLILYGGNSYRAADLSTAVFRALEAPTGGIQSGDLQRHQRARRKPRSRSSTGQPVLGYGIHRSRGAGAPLSDLHGGSWAQKTEVPTWDTSGN